MQQELGRCPLCSEPNRCAIAAGGNGERHCWCMDQPVWDLARPAAPPPSGRATSACLCQACARRLAAVDERG
jgi:hypothetical protein